MSYKEYILRIHHNGDREYLNKAGKRHREDGPACEWADGRKYWYINGQCHREDGPAIEYADGSKYWFINGKYLTEAEFLAQTRKANCDGKVVEIEGKKYRLVAETPKLVKKPAKKKSVTKKPTKKTIVKKKPAIKRRNTK